MVSSQGKRADSKAIDRQVLSQAETDSTQATDGEQIFRLIDSILSFEACLYHQVLPLALEEKNLLLGMVSPDDSAALDYVGRILSYMNYSMLIQPITPDAHREMLSAYLNYTGTSKSAPEQVLSPSVEHTVTSSAAKNPEEDTASIEQNQQATFILAATEAFNICLSDKEESQVLINTDSQSASTLPESLSTEAVNTQVATPKQPPVLESESDSDDSVLQVEAAHLSSPVDVLAKLPPKALLAELLGRVLAGGIGRLYFERQQQQGRILWSQNGVLQSVLEDLPLSAFQGIVNELKRLTNLPLTTVEEPKQVELERLYQEHRLLLRLRVMPGVHGEEATLQVLRGAALKFYQQQQLTRLSRDAVGIAQQLRHKLNELRERVNVNSSLNSNQVEALVTLNQLLENLDQQMKVLSSSTEPPKSIK